MAGETTVILHDHLGNVVTFVPADNITGLAVPVMNVSNQATRGIRVVGDDVTGDRPVHMGGRSTTSLVNKTPLVDNKMQELCVTADGRLITLDIGNPEDQIPTTPIILANDTSAHTLIATVGGGLKYALWGLDIVNASATPTIMILVDSVTTNELVRIGIPGFPGPATIRWAAPKRTAVNANITYQLTAAVGANAVYVSPTAFKTKV